MPDFEDIDMAILGLDDLHQRLSAFQKGDIVRGSVLPTLEYIEATLGCLDIALQVMYKRIAFHGHPLKEGREERHWRYFDVLKSPSLGKKESISNETGDTPRLTTELEQGGSWA